LIKEVDKGDTAQQINPTYLLYFNDKWGYDGELVNGKREGKGVWNMQDGRKYEGNFANDLPNGYGEITDTSGVIVKGIWKDGVLVQYQGYFDPKQKH